MVVVVVVVLTSGGDGGGVFYSLELNLTLSQSYSVL